jgi:hypothetical protein
LPRSSSRISFTTRTGNHNIAGRHDTAGTDRPRTGALCGEVTGTGSYPGCPTLFWSKVVARAASVANGERVRFGVTATTTILPRNSNVHHHHNTRTRPKTRCGNFARTQRTNAVSCSDQSSVPGRASCAFVCRCFSCCRWPRIKEEEKKRYCISRQSDVLGYCRRGTNDHCVWANISR